MSTTFSHPASSKGRALDAHLAGRGFRLERLDLRVPSANELRLSAMVDVVRGAIGEAPRALAIGSSLGGITVARAAERDARIVGCVLLAPAFRLVSRWRARMGEADWARWQRDGVFPYEDYATGGKLEVGFGLITDAARLDGDDAPEDDASRAGHGPRWPDLRVPTVIIHGSRDDTVDPELSRTYARTRPNVRLIEVDDGHQLGDSMAIIEREVDAMIARLGD
jgi:pimeloyl-ACP methyl ester carboxylesterase